MQLLQSRVAPEPTLPHKCPKHKARPHSGGLCLVVCGTAPLNSAPGTLCCAIGGPLSRLLGPVRCLCTAQSHMFGNRASDAACSLRREYLPPVEPSPSPGFGLCRRCLDFLPMSGLQNAAIHAQYLRNGLTCSKLGQSSPLLQAKASKTLATLILSLFWAPVLRDPSPQSHVLGLNGVPPLDQI